MTNSTYSRVKPTVSTVMKSHPSTPVACARKNVAQDGPSRRGAGPSPWRNAASGGAAALHHGMSVGEVEDLDLSYTPPLGSPYDALQIAARQWTLASKTTNGG